MIVAAALSAELISVLRTVDHLSTLKTVAICISVGRRAVISVLHGAVWLPLHMHGVSSCAVFARFFSDAILLRCKEEAH